MYFTEELKDVPGGINIYSRVGMEGGNKPPNTTENTRKNYGKSSNNIKIR